MTKKEQAGSKSIAVNIQDARNAWGDDTKKFIGREKSLSNKIKTSDRLFRMGDDLLGNAGADMYGIILEFGYAKYFYGDRRYTPGEISNPYCTMSSLNPDEKTWVPFESSEKVQATKCFACKHNKFGTAENGKGKACTDKRRLVLLVADSLKKQSALDISNVDLSVLEIPPTGIKNWASYLKYMTDGEGLPPYAFVTRFTFDPTSSKEIVQYEAHSIITAPSAVDKIKACLTVAGELACKEYQYSSADAEEEIKDTKPSKKKLAKKKLAKKKAKK